MVEDGQFISANQKDKLTYVRDRNTVCSHMLHQEKKIDSKKFHTSRTERDNKEVDVCCYYGMPCSGDSNDSSPAHQCESTYLFTEMAVRYFSLELQP